MGWGTPVDLGNNSTTPSTQTTLALTTLADINIGDLVVVLGGCNTGNNALTSAADSGGVNVYSFILGSNSNPAVAMAWSIATAKVTAGGTITGTGYSASSIRKGITAFKITPTAPVTLDSVAPATTLNTSTTNNIVSGALGSPAVLLVVGFNSGNNDPGAFTNLNGFTKVTGIPTNTPGFFLFTRVVQSSGSVTATLVWTNSVANRFMLRAWDAPNILTASAGSFGLTGNAAGLRVARKLSVGAGSFSLAGVDAGLRAARRIGIGAGSFTLTGTDAGLRSGRRLAIGAGAFSLAGIDAGLRATRRLAIGSGAFALAGSDAGLLAARRLAAGSGAYGLTGIDAALRAGRRIAADHGSFLLTGNDASFMINLPPAVPGRAATASGSRGALMGTASRGAVLGVASRSAGLSAEP